MAATIFDGPQTIANVEAALDRLREAMAGDEAISISLDGVTEADLAFAQVLLACQKSATAAKRQLQWLGMNNPVITEMLARAGISGTALRDETPAKGALP